VSVEAKAGRVLDVESIDQEGRGVGHWEGKTVFVEGALPGERVHFSPYRRKPTYEFATLGAVLRSSPQRVAPRCAHFGVCGGCSLQHMDPSAQVAAKQRMLEDNLWHIGRVRAERILPAIHGPAWEYRQRARFSVRHVVKKGGVLVGFHERRSSYVADMKSCEVVPARVSRLLPRLRTLVQGLSIRDRLPQIELACGASVDVLVLRILEQPTPADEAAIRAFADEHGVQIYLQEKGPETARPFHPLPGRRLHYRLPDFDLELDFHPTEFTQVNAAVNRTLVTRAVRLLDAQPGERVADLFCGLGNFGLAIARQGAHVVGFEGAAPLVRRAASNADANGLGHLCRFEVANLFVEDCDAVMRAGPYDRLLIDPPRDGAMELVKALVAPLPRRIVYVSCSPATLARDAGVLVHVHGYRLSSAGVANMFPHTAHVESIAVFDRDQ